MLLPPALSLHLDLDLLTAILFPFEPTLRFAGLELAWQRLPMETGVLGKGRALE